MNVKKKEPHIYLDYAGATPTDIAVVRSMEPFWNKHFANPWSTHHSGRQAREVYEESREILAGYIFARPEEIIFVSSGTEANALALRGVYESFKKRGDVSAHVILGQSDHPSVSGSARWFKDQGWEVSLAATDKEGLIDVSYFKTLLRPDTCLVSIALINSEIGVIQPIKEITRLVRYYRKEQGHKQGPLVHTDATQAGILLRPHVQSLGVDLLTLDAQKMYGPKGVGLLYVKKGTSIQALFFGEGGEPLRPGTPAIPLIVGFASATKIAQVEGQKESSRMAGLRDHFFSELEILGGVINGSKENRIANNVNVSFRGVNHQFLQIQLDELGVECATKSACLAEGAEGSHVIGALGGEINDALRFTMGRATKKKDIQKTIKTLKEALTLQNF